MGLPGFLPRWGTWKGGDVPPVTGYRHPAKGSGRRPGGDASLRTGKVPRRGAPAGLRCSPPCPAPRATYTRAPWHAATTCQKRQRGAGFGNDVPVLVTPRQGSERTAGNEGVPFLRMGDRCSTRQIADDGVVGNAPLGAPDGGRVDAGEA